MHHHPIPPQLLHTAWKPFPTNVASSHSYSHQFSQQNKTLIKFFAKASDSKATTTQSTTMFSEMFILSRNSRKEIQVSERLPFSSKPLLKFKLFSASKHGRQLSRRWAFTNSVLYKISTWSHAFFKPRNFFSSLRTYWGILIICCSIRAEMIKQWTVVLGFQLRKETHFFSFSPELKTHQPCLHKFIPNFICTFR